MACLEGCTSFLAIFWLELSHLVPRETVSLRKVETLWTTGQGLSWGLDGIEPTQDDRGWSCMDWINQVISSPWALWLARSWGIDLN